MRVRVPGLGRGAKSTERRKMEEHLGYAVDNLLRFSCHLLYNFIKFYAILIFTWRVFGENKAFSRIFFDLLTRKFGA